MTTSIDRTHCAAPRHGTVAAYSRVSCRCPDARELWRLNSKRKREGRAEPRLVPAVGSARMLQALAVMGWGLVELEPHTGWKRSRIANVRAMHKPTVFPQAARTVTKVYEQLWDVPGPNARARAHALRMGWVAPAAWDDDTINDPDTTPEVPQGDVVDEVAIQRVLSGHAPHTILTEPERVELARVHTARGGTVTSLAKLMGASHKRVRNLLAQAEGAA